MSPVPRCSHCRGKKRVHEFLCETHLKNLQKEWYEKAEKGNEFKNIEQLDGNLKEWSSFMFTAPGRGEIDHIDKIRAKEEYFRLAGQFLYDAEFDSELEKYIWEKHAEGISTAKIIKHLKSRGHTAYKDLVHGIIHKLSKEMLGKLK